MTLNPNQVRYPYGGGTDNPSESTAYDNPGGPTLVASVETAPLSLDGESLTSSVVRHPPLPAGIAQSGTDSPTGSIAETAAGVGEYESALLRSEDPEGGIDPVTGAPREAGQDETAGATETTSGTSPTGFPGQ